MSLDAVRDPHEGNGVVEYPDQLEPENFAVEGDRSLKVCDAKDNLTNFERFDRVQSIVRHRRLAED